MGLVDFKSAGGPAIPSGSRIDRDTSSIGKLFGTSTVKEPSDELRMKGTAKKKGESSNIAIARDGIAEAMRKRRLGEKITAYGEGSPETLKLLAEAMVSWRKKCKLNEAACAGVELFNWGVEHLGSKHPWTMGVMHTLAEIVLEGGDWITCHTFAEVLMRDRREEPDATATWTLMGNMYMNRQWWEKAESAQRHVLKNVKGMLESTHENSPMRREIPDLAMAMGDLADTLNEKSRMGKFVNPGDINPSFDGRAVGGREELLDEAEKLEMEVLGMQREKYGEDSKETLKAKAGLARTWRNIGRLKESEAELRAVVARSKKVIGEKHTITLAYMASYAETLYSLQRFEETELLGQRVLELKQELLGARHPKVMESVAFLAKIWCAQGRYQEALKPQLRVALFQCKYFGRQWLSALQAVETLSDTCIALGKEKDAQWLEDLLVTRSTVYWGRCHEETIKAWVRWTDIAVRQNRWKQAFFGMRRLVRMRQKALGPEDPMTIESEEELAKWRKIRKGKGDEDGARDEEEEEDVGRNSDYSDESDLEYGGDSDENDWKDDGGDAKSDFGSKQDTSTTLWGGIRAAMRLPSKSQAALPIHKDKDYEGVNAEEFDEKFRQGKVTAGLGGLRGILRLPPKLPSTTEKVEKDPSFHSGWGTQNRIPDLAKEWRAKNDAAYETRGTSKGKAVAWQLDISIVSEKDLLFPQLFAVYKRRHEERKLPAPIRLFLHEAPAPIRRAPGWYTVRSTDDIIQSVKVPLPTVYRSNRARPTQADQEADDDYLTPEAQVARRKAEEYANDPRSWPLYEFHDENGVHKRWTRGEGNKPATITIFPPDDPQPSTKIPGWLWKWQQDLVRKYPTLFVFDRNGRRYVPKEFDETKARWSEAWRRWERDGWERGEWWGDRLPERTPPPEWLDKCARYKEGRERRLEEMWEERERKTKLREEWRVHFGVEDKDKPDEPVIFKVGTKKKAEDRHLKRMNEDYKEELKKIAEWRGEHPEKDENEPYMFEGNREEIEKRIVERLEYEEFYRRRSERGGLEKKARHEAEAEALKLRTQEDDLRDEYKKRCDSAGFQCQKEREMKFENWVQWRKAEKKSGTWQAVTHPYEEHHQKVLGETERRKEEMERHSLYILGGGSIRDHDRMPGAFHEEGNLGGKSSAPMTEEYLRRRQEKEWGAQFEKDFEDRQARELPEAQKRWRVGNPEMAAKVAAYRKLHPWYPGING